MSETLTCVLCGAENHDVAMALIRWKDFTPTWTTAPRCKDRLACSDRVQVNGDPWPVVDGAAR